MGKLSKLPNIGKVVEQQLIQTGIETPEQLRETGSQQAWLNIRSIDPSACYNRSSLSTNLVSCLDSRLLETNADKENKLYAFASTWGFPYSPLRVNPNCAKVGYGNLEKLLLQGMKLTNKTFDAKLDLACYYISIEEMQARSHRQSHFSNSKSAHGCSHEPCTLEALRLRWMRSLIQTKAKCTSKNRS